MMNWFKNAIGKLLWQQVTTAVILTENMRQSTLSEGDNKLRTALSNMRYGACTAADLPYLESRTISRRPGHPNFSDPSLRNVSVTTGLNTQKDKINELGSNRCAEETHQELTHFYANDILCENADERRAQKSRKKEVVKVTKNIPPNM